MQTILLVFLRSDKNSLACATAFSLCQKQLALKTNFIMCSRNVSFPDQTRWLSRRRDAYRYLVGALSLPRRVLHATLNFILQTRANTAFISQRWGKTGFTKQRPVLNHASLLGCLHSILPMLGFKSIMHPLTNAYH